MEYKHQTPVEPDCPLERDLSEQPIEGPLVESIRGLEHQTGSTSRNLEKENIRLWPVLKSPPGKEVEVTGTR
jgi:hypothetical protein